MASHLTRGVSPVLAAVLYLILIASSALAQSPSAPASNVPASSANEAAPPSVPPPATGPIQDNSFLVEEAYNQEYGVVQHISSFVRYWNSKDWTYNFTQEWPGLHNARNQYSYGVNVVSPGAFPGAGAGFGDTQLNYRYQLVGSGETRAAFAPRLTLLIPSGQSKYGRGYGGWGGQVSLPLSYVLNRHFVTHWNAGATIVPRAKNPAGDTAFTTGYNLGQSVIWLATPRFNVLTETVWNGSETVVAHDQTQRSHSLFISPGVRWAYNLSHHLQIVPGVAVPIGVGPSSGERGLFVYLSFEHPFKSTDPASK